MAVGVLIELPGLERKEYEEVTAEMFGHFPMKASEAPDGLLVHSAGPNNGGWYVFDIWETQERYKKFGKEKLEPAVKAVTGRVPDARPQFFEVQSLVQSR
jgi:hypothetical protein